MHVVADRLSLRWYLGYDLGEPLPDHSSLTRIRARLGLDICRRFFEAIVEQCMQAGLVWGKELYFDATKDEANAALDSVAPRFAVEAYLTTLFGSAAADTPSTDDGEDGEGATPLPIVLAAEAQTDLAKAAARRHDWVGGSGRPDRTVTRGDSRRMADYRAGTSDPTPRSCAPAMAVWIWATTTTTSWMEAAPASSSPRWSRRPR